jgi:hypothetical protein
MPWAVHLKCSASVRLLQVTDIRTVLKFNLTYFSFRIKGSPVRRSGIELFPPLHLQLLPRLQIFRLRLATSGTYTTLKFPLPPLIDHASSIITQLEPEHAIEEITLKITFPNLKDLEDVQNDTMATWANICTALSKIGSLQKVTLFVVQGDALQNETMSWIKEAFFRMNSKAVLRIQATSCKYLPRFKGALIDIIFYRSFKIPAPLGFLGNADDTDLLREAFRRHDIV